jgi:hypothetical protein
LEQEVRRIDNTLFRERAEDMAENNHEELLKRHAPVSEAREEYLERADNRSGSVRSREGYNERLSNSANNHKELLKRHAPVSESREELRERIFNDSGAPVS